MFRDQQEVFLPYQTPTYNSVVWWERFQVNNRSTQHWSWLQWERWRWWERPFPTLSSKGAIYSRLSAEQSLGLTSQLRCLFPTLSSAVWTEHYLVWRRRCSVETGKGSWVLKGTARKHGISLSWESLKGPIAVSRPSPHAWSGTRFHYYMQTAPWSLSLSKERNHNAPLHSWLKLEETSVLVTHSRLALILNSETSPPYSLFQLSLFLSQKTLI